MHYWMQKCDGNWEKNGVWTNFADDLIYHTPFSTQYIEQCSILNGLKIEIRWKWSWITRENTISIVSNSLDINSLFVCIKMKMKWN